MQCGRSTPRDTQRPYPNSTQKTPSLDPNPGPSCCEATELTTSLMHASKDSNAKKVGKCHTVTDANSTL